MNNVLKQNIPETLRNVTKKRYVTLQGLFLRFLLISKVFSFVVLFPQNFIR